MPTAPPSWTERDLRGCGPEPPDPQWPGGARVAVSVVLNVQAAAELSLARGDERNESVYEIIEPVSGPNPCLSSHFDYGPRTGYWRLVRLLERFGVTCTISACGRTLDLAHWLGQDMAARGFEVACHSYRWEGHANMPEEHEREIIDRSVRAVQNATGERPLGWHTKGAASPNTRRLLVEAGFEYDSDAYDDDPPRLVDVAGHGHVIVPYSFITNDMRFMPIGNFVHGEDFARSTIGYLRRAAKRRRTLDVRGRASASGRPPQPDHRPGTLSGACLRQPGSLVRPPHRHRPPLATAGPSPLSRSVRTAF